jgi:3'-phosphoadenosine 5'-phosphosulfate (PAPS) 3'-phosphatase
VQYKGDDSPLTAADTESNRVICEGLQRVTPHVPIISEETKALAYDIRKAGPVTALLRCAFVCVCVRAHSAHGVCLQLQHPPPLPVKPLGVKSTVLFYYSPNRSCLGTCRATSTAGWSTLWMAQKNSSSAMASLPS